MPESQDAPNVPSPEELAAMELAATQENQAYQQAQLQYLQNRVAGLRVEVNRRGDRIAELEARVAELEPDATEDPADDLPTAGEPLQED